MKKEKPVSFNKIMKDELKFIGHIMECKNHVFEKPRNKNIKGRICKYCGELEDNIRISDGEKDRIMIGRLNEPF